LLLLGGEREADISVDWQWPNVGLELGPDTVSAQDGAEGGELDLTTLHRSMEGLAAAVNRGDLRVAESMLMVQAATLNAIFLNLAGRAEGNTSVDQFDMNMRLALRAQGQCRATLETLATIKNPPVFAKQANIAAGSQQVNNVGQVVNGTPARVRINEVAQTKLLEESIYGERVDGVEASAAGEGDSSVEAVGAVNGAADTSRQGVRVAERVPRRHA
jgi:hypothetical protein